jgi:hypothetical protein
MRKIILLLTTITLALTAARRKITPTVSAKCPENNRKSPI